MVRYVIRPTSCQYCGTHTRYTQTTFHLEILQVYDRTTIGCKRSVFALHKPNRTTHGRLDLPPSQDSDAHLSYFIDKVFECYGRTSALPLQHWCHTPNSACGCHGYYGVFRKESSILPVWPSWSRVRSVLREVQRKVWCLWDGGELANRELTSGIGAEGWCRSICCVSLDHPCVHCCSSLRGRCPSS